MSKTRQSLAVVSLLCLGLAACGRSHQTPTDTLDSTDVGAAPQEPGPSEMTEQGAIEHIRSLARNGTLKTSVSERYWDFDRKEYRTRFKQVKIPEGVPWRATNENGKWVVRGDFGLEGTQVHAEYVIDSQTLSVGEVQSGG